MMRVFRFLILVTLACVVSCSILLDTDTAQCTSTADCEARFPSRGLVCLGSSCLRPADPVVEAGPPAPTCSNKQCMAEEGARSGGSAICVANKCQPLKLLRDGASICVDEVLPLGANAALADEEVLVLGGFVPLKAGSPLRDKEALAYRLALEEIRTAGGLKIGKNGVARPVVMALCAAEPDLIEEGLKHLTEDLKVPVIVARFPDDRAADLVNRYAVKNEVFTMNPYPAPYALREQESLNGLAWHLLGGAEDVALAYRPLIEKVEPLTRAKKGLAPTDKVKVALVTTDFPADLAIAEVIMHGPQVPADGGLITRDPSGSIRINGKTTDENAALDPKAFELVPIKSTQKLPAHSTAEIIASIDEAVTKLVAFGPHVIIAVTFSELGELVKRYEQNFPQSSSALPQWVLSVGNTSVPDVLKHVADIPSFYNPSERFVGIQYAGSTMPVVRTQWLSRMATLYADQNIDPAEYSDRENAYDALYWIAYGLLQGTAVGTPANGTALRLGVRKLLIGPDVYPGSAQQIESSIQTMKSQSSVRFVGALGPRDIDPRTGTIFGTGAVYCYQKQPGMPVTVKYDVRRYDPAKRTLEPPDPVNPEACFVGFP